MKTFRQYLKESSGKYTGWKFPRDENIKQEYNVEYKHHIRHSFGDIFPKYEDFEKAVKEGDVVEFDNVRDMKVGNRSRTKSKESLIRLIKGYRSYPEFRNEKTIQSLYDRIENNESLDMPLILKSGNHLHIMAGNTRADVALQTGNTYKAIVIDITDLQ